MCCTSSNVPFILEFETCDLVLSIVETVLTAETTRRSMSTASDELGKMQLKPHTPTRSHSASNDNAGHDDLRTTKGGVVRMTAVAFLAYAAATSIANSIWQLPTIIRLVDHHILFFARIRFGQNEDVNLQDAMFIASLAYVLVCWRSPSLLTGKPVLRLLLLFATIQVCFLVLFIICLLADNDRCLHGLYLT